MLAKLSYLLLAIFTAHATHANELVDMAHVGNWVAVEEILQCPNCKINLDKRWKANFLCSVSIYHKRFCLYGHTALHHAAIDGNVYATRLLLQNGANPHLTDYTGQTALHLAVAGGYQEIEQLLLHYGADPQQKPRSFSFAPSPTHIITSVILGLGALLSYQYANRVVYSSKIYQTSESCVICLDAFSELLQRATHRLPCGHNNVCSGCLQSLIDLGAATCPECRGPI